MADDRERRESARTDSTIDARDDRRGGPALPDDITADDLDKDVRAELLSLAKPVAETVARHLVATGRLIDEEPEAALDHALAARRLASRIAAVREAVGLAAYFAGEWQTAIAELRTYHRMSGRQTHLAVLADCERALGRPERAVDLYRNADRELLSAGDAVELLIVAAGARADMGQRDAAVTMLQVRELTADEGEPWVARLRYAYADALLAAGRRDEAREWFSRAAQADEESETDAAERLLDLDGVVLEDAGSDDEDEDGDSDQPVGETDDGRDTDEPTDEDDDRRSDDDDDESDDDESDDDDDDDESDDDESDDGTGTGPATGERESDDAARTGAGGGAGTDSGADRPE